MKRILCEGKYGHGARHSVIKSWFRRTWRRIRGRHIVAKSGQGFDWTTTVNTLQKIGGVKKKNQGDNFSCGRQTGAYSQFILRKFILGIDEGEISAKSGYGQYCEIGGGMSIDSLETDMGSFGANLEKDVPSYDAYENPLSEAMMIETSWATPAMIQDAAKRAGLIPFNVAIDKDSIALAIQSYGLTNWIIRGQNNGSWLSNNPLPPISTNPNPTWLHFMTQIAAGTKNNTPTITSLNSWGEEIGDQGCQDFTDAYIQSGNILEVITYVPANQLKSSQMPVMTLAQKIWQAIVVWLNSNSSTKSAVPA